jgi:23S rRNA pseudouridine1911/1915/1917 synthase
MVEPIHVAKDFVAYNKPAGMLVHGVQGVSSGGATLADIAVAAFPEVKKVGDDPELRPGIVHRLDKGTSGVIIVARTQPFFEFLKRQFQTHQVRKTYRALVTGRLLGKGVIDTPIGLKPGTVKRSTMARNMKMVKDAVTEYRVEKAYQKEGFGNRAVYYSLVEVMPKTGRTHQIRVHLASIGHPIVGDTLYGAKTNPLGLTRQFLHAEAIEFSTPQGNRLRIEAELPEELQAALTVLER